MNLSAMHTFRWVALATFFLAIHAHGNAQVVDGKVLEDWVDLYEPHADDEMPYRLMKPMGFDSRQR